MYILLLCRHIIYLYNNIYIHLLYIYTGSSFNKCGKVYCRYLPALTVNDLPTNTSMNPREAMLRLLRRTMLNDVINHTPIDTACDVTWKQRLISLSIVLFMHILNILVCRYIYVCYIQISTDITTNMDIYTILSLYIYNISVISSKLLVVILLITLLLFIYISYIQPIIFNIYKKWNKTTTKKKQN